MKNIGNFRFEDSGVIVVFSTVPTSLAKDQKYTFYVENDEKLTDALRRSFATVEVVERYISRRASLLFDFIKNANFTPYATAEELAALSDTFRERFGKLPAFIFKDVSKKNIESFSSNILNINKVFESGVGRTKIESKVNTLKNLFEILNKF